MDTEDLLKQIQYEYETSLSAIFHRQSRGDITEQEATSRRTLNRRWFHLIYSALKPYEEVYCQDLSPELRTKYDRDESYPLCSVIFYHGQEIPCYNDDYGQQVFARFEGCEWSGGAYNFCYADDFCVSLDLALEDKLWKQWQEQENLK